MLPSEQKVFYFLCDCITCFSRSLVSLFSRNNRTTAFRSHLLSATSSSKVSSLILIPSKAWPKELTSMSEAALSSTRDFSNDMWIIPRPWSLVLIREHGHRKKRRKMLDFSLTLRALSIRCKRTKYWRKEFFISLSKDNSCMMIRRGER